MNAFLKSIFPVFFALFILLPQTNLAQKVSLKLNTSTGIDLRDETFWLGKFAPVLIIENKSKGIHQIEWSSFLISREKELEEDGNTITDGELTDRVNLGWRYQYSVPLSKKNEKFTPYLGISASMGIFQKHVEPFVSNKFRTKEFHFISRIAAVPSFRFKANERFFFDLEIPITLIEIDNAWRMEDNPTIPADQQDVRTRDLETLITRRLQARLGLGIHLNKK